MNNPIARPGTKAKLRLEGTQEHAVPFPYTRRIARGLKGIQHACLAALVFMIAFSATMARARDYVLEAYLCEVDAQTLHERIWTIPTNLVAGVTTFVDHQTARAFIDDYADEVVAFPLLQLEPGKRVTADEQEPLRYGVEFDDNGRATRHDEVGVGLRIEAEFLEEMPNGWQVEFLVEQTLLDNWRPYTPREGVDARMPAFKTRSWNMTPTFRPYQWLWIGTASRGTYTDGRHLITLIRIRAEEAGEE